MKILFASNYFPPDSKGGYEQWCQEVGYELAERGHEVHILTCKGKGPRESRARCYVHRILNLEVCGGIANTLTRLLRRKGLEQESLSQVAHIMGRVEPDAAMIWGMWNVPRSVPSMIERVLDNHTAYYFCDYWTSLPSAFEQQVGTPARRPVTGPAKRVLARCLLSRIREQPQRELLLRHPVCVSQAVKRHLVELDVPVSHARVIPGGTSLQEFPLRRPNTGNAQLKFIYVGRLTEDKGVHTAVEAMDHCQDTETTLAIFGGGDPDYLQKLERMVQARDLASRVHFQGRVERSKVPSILSEHDALLFPSIWEEPFARTVLEGMAAQLVVIGTTTGGTPEILEEGVTGLTFKAGDAIGLARQMDRLAEDRGLCSRLAVEGAQRVREYYTLERMTDDIEELLVSLQHR